MHVTGRSLSLDTGLAAHKLSVVPHTRSLFLTMSVTVSVLAGCGDREPEPRAAAPQPPVDVPSPPIAELTGWPTGLGRALVLRLGPHDDAYRLIVAELGDRRFADSSISMKVGDSIPVELLSRRGKLGDAGARVVDAEDGVGACLTWPSVTIEGATYAPRKGAAWRLAVERDSVTPVVIDSLMGMRGADSLKLASAVHALVSAGTAAPDSTLRGIPFTIRRAYSLVARGVGVVAAELARTSSSEADPREERLFIVGERPGDGIAHRLVYSRSAAGPADNTPVTELLAAVVSRRSSRPVLVLVVEGTGGLRLHLVERVGRGQWRPSWSSVVSFC